MQGAAAAGTGIVVAAGVAGLAGALGVNYFGRLVAVGIAAEAVRRLVVAAVPVPVVAAQAAELEGAPYLQELPDPLLGEIATKRLSAADLCRLSAVSRSFRDSLEEAKNSPEFNYARGRHHYNKQEYEQAFTFLGKAAEQGHAGAQFFLGAIHFNGYGVKKDYAKAIKWWRLSAAQEYAPEQFLLDKLLKKHPELAQHLPTDPPTPPS
jgi:TPR repeat protein